MSIFDGTLSQQPVVTSCILSSGIITLNFLPNKSNDGSNKQELSTFVFLLVRLWSEWTMQCIMHNVDDNVIID